MTQGRPPLFTDMRIVNDGGQELPWDGRAAGELQVRGPHVIRAYFKVIPPSRLVFVNIRPDCHHWQSDQSCQLAEGCNILRLLLFCLQTVACLLFSGLRSEVC